MCAAKEVSVTALWGTRVEIVKTAHSGTVQDSAPETESATMAHASAFQDILEATAALWNFVRRRISATETAFASKTIANATWDTLELHARTFWHVLETALQEEFAFWACVSATQDCSGIAVDSRMFRTVSTHAADEAFAKKMACVHVMWDILEAGVRML